MLCMEKQVAQLWQRPRDACFTLIYKIVKIAFLRDFRGSVSALSLAHCKTLISDD